MEQKTRCIVLRTVKYGDNKVIADLLCRECGRQSVIVSFGSGTRASGSRRHSATGGRRQLFQPLTILSVHIHLSPRKQLQRLGEVSIATPYTTIPFDAGKTSLAFFIAELLTSCTRNTPTDARFYDYVEQSLTWLDTSVRGIQNYHLMFMMHLTRFMGFLPDMDSYSPGSVFNLRDGSFSTFAPPHGDFLSPAESANMLLIMRMNYHNVHLFHFSRDERNRIVDICLLFYRLHIPSFGEMKSLEVLRAF